MALNLSLFLLRFVLGFFFVVYRFRWIYDPEARANGTHWLNNFRHFNLEKKLCTCGWGMHPALAAFVAMVEIMGGLGLMFGALTHLAAFGILILLIIASSCTAKHKIEIQNNGKGPEDAIDVVSCYLWTVEPVYILLAFVVMLLGAGDWSVDHLAVLLHLV